MNKVKILLITVGAIFIVFGSSLLVASAAGIPIDPSYYPAGAPTITGEKPNEKSNLTVDDSRVKFTARIINALLSVAGIVAIFYIVNNGWWIIASGGAEETITQYKKGLMWAVVGLILVILSYSIINFIIYFAFQADQKPEPAKTAAEVSVLATK